MAERGFKPTRCGPCTQAPTHCTTRPLQVCIGMEVSPPNGITQFNIWCNHLWATLPLCSGEEGRPLPEHLLPEPSQHVRILPGESLLHKQGSGGGVCLPTRLDPGLCRERGPYSNSKGAEHDRWRRGSGGPDVLSGVTSKSLLCLACTVYGVPLKPASLTCDPSPFKHAPM